MADDLSGKAIRIHGFAECDLFEAYVRDGVSMCLSRTL